jgi:hypothetical protein
MGVQLPLPVPFESVFPKGCYITSEEAEPISDYVDGKPGPQSIDDTTGLLLWSVTVHDADKEVKGPKKSLKVKILSAEKPEIPPSIMEDVQFCPAILDGLMIRPYATEVMTGRWTVAYSVTAHGIREPTKAAKPEKPGDNKDAKAPKPS